MLNNSFLGGLDCFSGSCETSISGQIFQTFVDTFYHVCKHIVNTDNKAIVLL